jgi:hypothetical protein
VRPWGPLWAWACLEKERKCHCSEGQREAWGDKSRACLMPTQCLCGTNFSTGSLFELVGSMEAEPGEAIIVSAQCSEGQVGLVHRA